MPRISVSLPEELMTRLEPVKESLNVSQVCREALERRVDAFERSATVESEDLDMESLTARLREDRALVEGKFESAGRRNAAGWLGTAPYLELKTVAEAASNGGMAKYRLPRAAFRTMKRDMDAADVDCEDIHAVAYKTAWLDYVRAVWSQVVDRVEGGNGSAAAEETNGSEAVEETELEAVSS